MSTVEAPASHLPLPMQNILSRLAANSTEAEQALVRKAYAYAAAAHAGQVRLSGEPYLSHPLAVAEVLAELGFDAHSVAAGLLHDTVEDTKVTLEEVDAEFGEQVADIVDGVTKISMMRFDSKEEQQAENIRKMILAMSHDIRTPMNVIMGFTNIALQHADDPGKMKECLEKIQISGGNLQELIDDVLDISRIESGEFKIVSQAVKLPELFDFYCQAIAGMAEAEHIPIIALTANAYHEDIQKCLAAGMNAHLSKPINIDRAVRTIIECARTAKENG